MGNGYHEHSHGQRFYVPNRAAAAAIIDLYSRYVVHWSVSNSMDAEWCTQLLKEAVEMHGKPEIINTDQGSQYTSETFVEAVLSADIKLSMDGKGRATDNAFMERLWRSVKYKKVYLNPPVDGKHLDRMMQEYFEYYNNQRRHTSIEDEKPVEKYFAIQPGLSSAKAA